ncbi:MAG: Stp1/IreP family PP2C-type Ser/Thr phosphatase [Coriobacteriales bacterium]|jgi:protein phosphatase|nr:Stp1/IreP family PP2C-type Ser/Thr phosphatase [Coriobacteriales bacterium]
MTPAKRNGPWPSSQAGTGGAKRAGPFSRVGAKSRTAPHADVGSRTDVGRIRDHNEDSLLVLPPLYVVADGMGGHAAGEVASELAVRVFEDAEIRGTDGTALRDAVLESNRVIIDAARRGIGREGMGTTLTAAVIENDQLLIAQVGDSRAYLMRDGQLRQVTRDHSFVAQLVATGRLTPEEARVHPKRSVITRALGSDEGLQPDIYEVCIHTGDRLMLCSDGLNSMVDTARLSQLLAAAPDPQAAADALVDAANEAGGHDNITVIVVDINDARPQAALRQKRRFMRGIAAFLLVLVLIVAGTVGGVYAYARNAAFLIEEDGYVALYRGLPGDVLGFELKWREERTRVPSTAPPLNPTTVSGLATGIQTESLDEARDLVRQYEKLLEGR